MPVTREAVPWRIYLLIDPTTGPSNHALGTIFYVGLLHELPQPVDLREAAEPESLPEGEGAARERLGTLSQAGIRVIVEVVPEQAWPSAESGHLARTVGTLCACLHPAPLNERLKSVRWPGSLVHTVERAQLVPLPEDGAILRTHTGPTPIAQLPVLDEQSLFGENLAVIEGSTAPKTVAKALREGGPLPLLLVADGRSGRGVIPGGFVFGVWVAEAIEPINEGQTRWRVLLHDDPEMVGALRRRYLHQRVRLDDFNALRLRKA
jgi:hypothetical protein